MISTGNIYNPKAKNTYESGEYWKASDVNSLANVTRYQGVSTRLELIGGNTLRVHLDGVDRLADLGYPLKLKLIRRPNKQSSKKEWYMVGEGGAETIYGAALDYGFTPKDWMRNEGVVQSSWDIDATTISLGHIDIELGEWLVDAMRSVNSVVEGLSVGAEFLTGCFVGTKGGNTYNYSTGKFLRPTKPSVVTFSFVVCQSVDDGTGTSLKIVSDWKNTIDIGSTKVSGTSYDKQYETLISPTQKRLLSFYKKIR